MKQYYLVTAIQSTPYIRILGKAIQSKSSKVLASEMREVAIRQSVDFILYVSKMSASMTKSVDGEALARKLEDTFVLRILASGHGQSILGNDLTLTTKPSTRQRRSLRAHLRSETIT